MKKAKRQKPPSARQLFEQCVRELADLNYRYKALFEFVHDANTYAPQGLSRESIPVVLERDMKAGETLNMIVPMKFGLRKS